MQLAMLAETLSAPCADVVISSRVRSRMTERRRGGEEEESVCVVWVMVMMVMVMKVEVDKEKGDEHTLESENE